MSYSVNTTWKSGHAFEGETRGIRFAMDTPGEETQRYGASPKELVLGAICGCTGIDVVSILNKMRAKLKRCDIVATAEKTASAEPIVFAFVHLVFDIEAESVSPDQVLRAVMLSQTKYCGVTAMIAKTCPVTYEVKLNGQSIGTGKSDFNV